MIIKNNDNDSNYKNGNKFINIGSAGGMSLHESQSLFVEMQIIKSLPVSQFIQQILKDKLGKDPNVWSSEVI